MSENEQSYEEMVGQDLWNRLGEPEQAIVMQYLGEREKLIAAELDPDDENSWENQELRTQAVLILGRVHGKFKGRMPKGEG